MKASVGGYARAKDLRHALDLLAASDGMGRVLAGGQSLIAAMNMRLSAGALNPPKMILLSRLIIQKALLMLKHKVILK